jgi:hypothetical protein
MALAVLGFISIMVATFVLIAVMTKPSHGIYPPIAHENVGDSGNAATA